VKTRIFEETEQQLGDFPDGGRETSWKTGTQDVKYDMPCNVELFLGKQVVTMESLCKLLKILFSGGGLVSCSLDSSDLQPEN
jgi:hypothetical protein